MIEITEINDVKTFLQIREKEGRGPNDEIIRFTLFSLT